MSLLLIFITWYVDWLQVSQDESRPFYYPITLLFSKKETVVVDNDDKTNPLIEIDERVRKDNDSVVIQNVSKVYPGTTTNALTNISFSFSKSEIFGLLGYNGAGKSTLINILRGVHQGQSKSLELMHPQTGSKSQRKQAFALNEIFSLTT
jgi:ABC-type uncharacterized transport system ATPase subunit